MIISIGEILWDSYGDQQILGGAPANFAYHLTQIGFNATLISAIGDDQLGQRTIKTLDKSGINHQIEVTQYPTGIAKILSIDYQGVAQYSFPDNSAWDNLTYSAELSNLIKRCRIINFGTLAQRNSKTRNTIEQIMLNIPQKAMRILDLNLRLQHYDRDIITRSLKYASVLKVNKEELTILNKILDLNIAQEPELCQQLLHQFTLDIIILTKGDYGSMIYTKGKFSFVPAQKVEVVDTIGAGDAFNAAFIAAFLNESSLQEAHHFATRYAAYICTQRGAMPDIPDHFVLKKQQ